MTDKERILLILVRELVSQIALTFNRVESPSDIHIKGGWCFDKKDTPVGALVTCITCRPHDWLVGYVVENQGGRLLLREIGSSRTCWVDNESFYILDNLDNALNKKDLLEGDQRLVYEKVNKTLNWHIIDNFSLGDLAWKRFAGIGFPAKNTITLKLRTKWTDTVEEKQLKVNKRTSLKEIARQIKESYAKD